MKTRFMDTAVNYYELKEEYAGLGFIDPAIANDLRSKLLNGVESPMLQMDVKGEDANVRFILSHSRNEHGRICLEFIYGLAIPKKLKIPEDTFRDVSTTALSTAMKAVDWSADYGTQYYDEHSLNGLATHEVNKLGFVAAGLKVLKEYGSQESLRAYERLLVNHWSGTPAEKHSVNYALASESYLREQVFAPEVDIKSATDLLIERLKVPEPAFNVTQIPVSKEQANLETYNVRSRSDQSLQVSYSDIMTKLCNLGFLQTDLDSPLRRQLIGEDQHFMLMNERRTDDYTVTCTIAIDRFGGPQKCVKCYKAELNLLKPDNRYTSACMGRIFEPGVRLETAAAVLANDMQKDNHRYLSSDVPVSAADANEYLKGTIRLNLFQDGLQYLLNQTKSNKMNTQNLEFLKNTFLNLGFGDKLNDELEKKVKAGNTEFTLQTTQTYDRKNVDYTLHLKKGEQDMHFLNRIDAQQQGKAEMQSFYINKGNGFTAKEMHNLMEDRAVFKQAYNKEGEPYQAWFKLDRTDLTTNGQPKIKSHNFDAEKFLEGKGIKEMADPTLREDLMRSLKKGNRQQITTDKNDKEQRFFIAVSPKFKTVDLYDQHLKKIKREEIFQPRQAKDTSKAKSTSQKQTETASAKPVKKKSGKVSKISA